MDSSATFTFLIGVVSVLRSMIDFYRSKIEGSEDVKRADKGEDKDEKGPATISPVSNRAVRERSSKISL